MWKNFCSRKESETQSPGRRSGDIVLSWRHGSYAGRCAGQHDKLHQDTGGVAWVAGEEMRETAVRDLGTNTGYLLHLG